MLDALITDAQPLVLASASPRRVTLLRAAGVEPFVIAPPAGVESPWTSGSPDAHARTQAAAKARAVLDAARSTYAPAWVLAADTIVVLDDAVLEKPRDAAAAAGMLRALSGRTHHVLTAIALAETAEPGGALDIAVEDTAVTFAPLDDTDIAAYVS